MKVILFGASGMVGQGVLRECLLDADVDGVLSIGRSPIGIGNAKLRERVHADLADPAVVETELRSFDACFFCLGVSSAGMSEADYRRVTHDLTLAIARPLSQLNPAMVFIYVSGAGTDSSEQGRSMWARVKGQTENALLALPFQAVMFRPGMIVPLHGITSKTRLYRVMYSAMRPLLPLLRALFPKSISTTEQVGRAMLAVVRRGAPKRVMEASDINAM
jgi:uncharacterized protein YbjT (DUF2867 family)